MGLIDGLEDYADAIVVGPHTSAAGLYRELAWGMRCVAEAWLEGRRVGLPDGPHEATPALLRHYLWLSEGILDPEVAAAFRAALPAWLRQRCDEDIAVEEARRG